MANVAEHLQQLLNARYGKDVRQSMHDSIEAINTQLEESVAATLESIQVAQTAAEEAKNAVTSLEEKINNSTFGESSYGTLAINSDGDLILTQEDSAAQTVSFAINDRGELEVTTNE